MKENKSSVSVLRTLENQISLAEGSAVLTVHSARRYSTPASAIALVPSIVKFKTEIKIDSDYLHSTFSTHWTLAMNLDSVLQLGPNNSSEKRQTPHADNNPRTSPDRLQSGDTAFLFV